MKVYIPVLLVLIGLWGMLSTCGINPTKPEAKAIRYFNQGVQAYQSQEVADAYAYFKAAVELDPNLWQAYENAGLILAEKEKYEEAIQWFKDGLAADETNVKLHYNLAIIYYKLGDYKKTKAYFEKIYELDPTYQFGKNNHLYLEYLDEVAATSHSIIVLPDERKYLALWDMDETSRVIIVKNVGNEYSSKVDELSSALVNAFQNPFLHGLGADNVTILTGNYLQTGLLEEELGNTISYLGGLEESVRSVVVVLFLDEAKLASDALELEGETKTRTITGQSLSLKGPDDTTSQFNLTGWIDQYSQVKIKLYFAIYPISSEAPSEQEDTPSVEQPSILTPSEEPNDSAESNQGGNDA